MCVISLEERNSHWNLTQTLTKRYLTCVLQTSRLRGLTIMIRRFSLQFIKEFKPCQFGDKLASFLQFHYLWGRGECKIMWSWYIWVRSNPHFCIHRPTYAYRTPIQFLWNICNLNLKRSFFGLIWVSIVYHCHASSDLVNWNLFVSQQQIQRDKDGALWRFTTDHKLPMVSICNCSHKSDQVYQPFCDISEDLIWFTVLSSPASLLT